MKIIKVLLILIVLQLAMISVFSLGVSPSRIVVDSKEDINQEFSFRIINSENNNIHVNLNPRGMFTEYVNIENPSVDILPNGEATIRYRVRMPYFARHPGNNLLEIVAQESSGNSSAQTSISGGVAVVHQLILKSPFEGKHADLIFTSNDPDYDKDLSFAYYISNDGAENIINLNANLNIYDSDNNPVVSKSYTFRPLSSGDGRKETIVLDSPLPPGDYSAITTLNYDSNIIVKETTFSIKKKPFDIISVGSPNFKLGEINRIDIAVKNNQNSNSNAYADISILDDNGKTIDEIKTQPKDIGSSSTETLNAYWDTKDIIEGSYDIKIKLIYDKGFINSEFGMTILKDKIIIAGKDLSGNAVIGNQNTKGSFTSVLILAFIIVIIANIILIFYIRRRMNQGI